MVIILGVPVFRIFTGIANTVHPGPKVNFVLLNSAEYKIFTLIHDKMPNTC